MEDEWRRPMRSSPNFQPVFLSHRRNDTVQAEVFDQLSVVVRDVPDGNDGDAEFSIRSGITAFHPVERIFLRERSQYTIRVIEGVLEIFDQLGFGFRRIVTALFAVVGWFLALKFVEEGELGTGDVLH